MDKIFKKYWKECNTGKKRKVLIVLDNVHAGMISNNKLNSIVTGLFIRGRELNISLVSIMQSHFKVPKDTRLKSMLNFLMKIPKRKEL